MSYTSIAEVNALLPNNQQVAATPPFPIMSQLQVWIDQLEARIDVALQAGGHVSPATDPAMKKAVAIIVAIEAARMVVVKRTGAEEDDDTAFDRAIAQFSGVAEGSSGGAGGTIDEASSGTFDSVSAFPKAQTRNW